MNTQKLLISVVVSVSLILGTSGTVEAASHDVAWTFGNVSSSSYRLDAFEPSDAGLGASIGAEDPTLTVRVGRRYQVTVTNYLSHPFEVLAKGTSAGADTILLAMGGRTGTFESDPGVAWVDNGSGTVTFTLTLGLYNAMIDSGHVPGYRCGVHVFTMRGNFNVLGVPPDDPIPDQVENDDCSNARPVGDVMNLPFDTREATFDGPGLCMTSPNIWYCYTASCTGDVTVSLLGSSYDTVLAAYNGCGCNPTSNGMVACNDDFGGSQSQITFAAIAGNQYLIEIGGFGSATGQGVLTISCEGQSIPPSSNDDCFNASPVGDVMNLPFDTREATFDGPGLCMTSPNIWYCYTASCTGDVTVSLLGSGFDTRLAAYNGCGCNPTSNGMVACNDDFGSGLQSQVTFTAIAGNQYLIEIGGFGSATGQGVLTISCEGAVSPQKPDLGDAPDSTNNFGRIMGAFPFLPSITANYPTVFDDGSGVGPYGPVHLNSQVVAYLGKMITSETEADTRPDEDGENNIQPSVNRANRDDGDDGVALPLNLPDCGWATIDYEVTVVTPGTDLWVNVWLDFNRDGDWDDTVDCPGGPATEWAVQNQYLFNLPTGLNQISTPGFLSSNRQDGPEEIWMRITLSEQPWKGGSDPGEVGNGGSGPQTKYEIGETEDYFFVPDTTNDTELPLCVDVNGDGVIDILDLVVHMTKWLETCP